MAVPMPLIRSYLVVTIKAPSTTCVCCAVGSKRPLLLDRGGESCDCVVFMDLADVVSSGYACVALPRK